MKYELSCLEMSKNNYQRLFISWTSHMFRWIDIDIPGIISIPRTVALKCIQSAAGLFFQKFNMKLRII